MRASVRSSGRRETRSGRVLSQVAGFVDVEAEDGEGEGHEDGADDEAFESPYGGAAEEGDVGEQGRHARVAGAADEARVDDVGRDRGHHEDAPRDEEDAASEMTEEREGDA